MENTNVNVNVNAQMDTAEVNEERQHVTFLIDEETYGIQVGKVKEIIGMVDITRVPNTAYFMEGVISICNFPLWK